MKFARDGDTVIVHSVDRLARNLGDLRHLVESLTARSGSVKGSPLRSSVASTGDAAGRSALIGDIDEVDRLLSVILKSNPSVASFVRIAKNPDGRFNRKGLQTAPTFGFRIVKWNLDES